MTFLLLSNPCPPPLGDECPRDGKQVVFQMKYVSLSLFCVIVVLASGGIILALSFLCFNVKHRNHR